MVFRWSGSVQTVCPFCKSILVRTDIDLTKVGKVADLPPDSSPIQIGAEGVVDNKAFTVAGRILYEYELGGWNEWHLVFNDGSSGWLSDAQCEYAISFQRETPFPLPSADSLAPMQTFKWFDHEYSVTVITNAQYAGVQGELPFEFWDKKQVPFADLPTTDSHFATLDYSGEKPLLFLGEALEYEALQLKNVRLFEKW